jgi:dolichol-phosphate mannosyltransferase
MGRRYLSTLMMVFFQRMLISDDLMAERLSSRDELREQHRDLADRVKGLEQRIERLGGAAAGQPAPIEKAVETSEVAQHLA